MKISCILVEDEPLAQQRAISYIRKVPSLELVGVFSDALEAFAFLQTQPVELLFLDINLGELSGLQLLASTPLPNQVIITTAYPDYAVKGYELNVTDYLLKPYSFERFLQAIGKVKPVRSPGPSSIPSFMFIKTEHRLDKVNLDEILYIEGMRDYRRIHTAQKKLMTLQTFTELERSIPPAILFRVHKSFMVSIAKIESIERDAVKIGPIYIPVSATYRKAFYQFLQEGSH